MPNSHLSAQPSALQPSQTVARRIVANLLQRKRFARQMLMKAQTDNAPELILHSLNATYSEAHNAAESARRILYHGVDAL